MGKGKTIEGYVKAYVFRRARKEDRTPREELAKTLVGELRAMRRTPPAIKTLKKMISAARNQEPNPQDQPWHLGTLEKYPILPEALRTVLRAWQSSIKKGIYLSIREAKWVSRLSGVLGDNDIQLIDFAVRLAEDEIVVEANDTPGPLLDEATSHEAIDSLCAAAGIWVSDPMPRLRAARRVLEAEMQGHIMAAGPFRDEPTLDKGERLDVYKAKVEARLAAVDHQIEYHTKFPQVQRRLRLKGVRERAKSLKAQKKAGKRTSGPEEDLKRHESEEEAK